jgi:hypothetical protein
LGLDWSVAAAMGDDWPDLPMMRNSAFACAIRSILNVESAHLNRNHRLIDAVTILYPKFHGLLLMSRRILTPQIRSGQVVSP